MLQWARAAAQVGRLAPHKKKGAGLEWIRERFRRRGETAVLSGSPAQDRLRRASTDIEGCLFNLSNRACGGFGQHRVQDRRGITAEIEAAG